MRTKGLCALVLFSLLAGVAVVRPAQAASGHYASIIADLDVESGSVTLPGAQASGFAPPLRWTVSVDDVGKTALEVIRQRYVDLVQLSGVDWDDPAVQQKVDRFVESLDWRVEQQNSSTGEIAGGLETVRLMAIAYHLPGTAYYHSQTLITGHLCPAVRYEQQHNALYPENGFPDGWWRWEVAVPFQILDILFAVGPQLDTACRDTLENMLIWLNQWSGRNASSAPPYNTTSPAGDLFSLQEANGAWFRTVALLTGLYFRLPPVVEWAVQEINIAATVNDELTTEGLPSFGIKADGTTWDHGYAPNQLYGDHLFETLAFVAYLMQGDTTYGLSPAVGAYLDTAFERWIRVNFFRGLEMPATRGRWPHLTEAGEVFMGALFRLGTEGVTNEGDYLRLVADWLREHPGDLDLDREWWGFASPWFGNFHAPGDALLAQPLLAAAQARVGTASPPPLGGHYYPLSEVLAVRSAHRLAMLAMRSGFFPLRTINRSHDAMLLVMTAANYRDYRSLDEAGAILYDNVTAVAGEPYSDFVRESGPMAAGLGVDFGGAAMLKQKTPESQSTWTEANKSCFFFDEEIVCLGTAMTSNDGRVLRTYLRAYPKATHSLQLGTGWLHEGAIGLVLPDHPAVRRETLTFEKDPPWERLYVEHGVRPAAAAYTAIYLPESSAERTAAYAAAPDAVVLARTATLHLVRDASTAATGGAFFAADASAGYAASAPLLFLERTVEGLADSLAVANPFDETQTARLTLPHRPTPWLQTALDGAEVVVAWSALSASTVVTVALPPLGSLSLDHTLPTFERSRLFARPAGAWHGETVHWTFAVRNEGGSLVTPLTVSVALPAGVLQTQVCSSTLAPGPQCGAGELHWTGVLSDVPEVVLMTSAQVTETERLPLVATASLDAGLYGRWAFDGVLIANPLQMRLPLIFKGGQLSW